MFKIDILKSQSQYIGSNALAITFFDLKLTSYLETPPISILTSPHAPFTNADRNQISKMRFLGVVALVATIFTATAIAESAQAQLAAILPTCAV